jgi:hypothetical protein
MRSRVSHLACLLLLLSSLAMSDARAGGATPSRTPGGVFVRNLLLKAVVDEAEPAVPVFEDRQIYNVPVAAHSVQKVVGPASDPAARTAHVHAVTGSSL